MGTERVPDAVAHDAAAIDDAADGLLAVFDGAREQMRQHLSASQLRALLAIEGSAGLNLRGLAERLGVVISSASRLCDRLVAAGLLERRQSDEDRREVLVSLSTGGHKLLADLRRRRRERLARVLARMSPAERAALRRGLEDFRAAAG